ncbi:hypothetical protein DFH28DRAFT_880348 [Melampsora americana]|nr:hypothetical protein DFH28DRAFT_880348 [Melampsora americana]
MYSLLTFILVSQAFLLQPICCNFKELATASTASSKYPCPRKFGEVDTTLSLSPGSDIKKYPGARRFVTRKQKPNSWLKLYEGSRKPPETIELFPLHTEGLGGKVNDFLDTSPQMIKAHETLHHKKDKSVMGSNEDVILRLGRTSEHLSSSEAFHSNFLPADHMSIKREADVELEIEKEVNGNPVHIHQTNHVIKKPKTESVSMGDNSWSISQGSTLSPGVYDAQYNDLRAQHMSRLPGNEQDGPEISDHVSTTENLPQRIGEYLICPETECNHIGSNVLLIIGISGMNLFEPFQARKIIIPKITWDFNAHHQQMQLSLSESYELLKVSSSIRLDKIHTLLRDYPELVYNLGIFMKQQLSAGIDMKVISNTVNLLVGLWIRQSRVSEIYGISNRKHELQVKSFEALVSIIQHPEFQLHPVQGLGMCKYKNEFYKIFDFVHRSDRQTRSKRYILYSLQNALLERWNHIRPQDSVSLSRANDKMLRQIIFDGNDADF